MAKQRIAQNPLLRQVKPEPLEESSFGATRGVPGCQEIIRNLRLIHNRKTHIGQPGHP
jgi:hypothetical protein